jgi:hypothetical protein
LAEGGTKPFYLDEQRPSHPSGPDVDVLHPVETQRGFLGGSDYLGFHTVHQMVHQVRRPLPADIDNERGHDQTGDAISPPVAQ